MNLKYKRIEKIVKGFANHRRIQVLELLEKYPDSSVDNISESLNVNFVTIADHIRKLSEAGLVEKNYKGRFVLHRLNAKGKHILSFCKMLK